MLLPTNFNCDAILQLIWSLILKYQIGQTGTGGGGAKKMLLEWVNEIVPGIKVNDFKKSYVFVFIALSYFLSAVFDPRYLQWSSQRGLSTSASPKPLSPLFLALPNPHTDPLFLSSPY